MRCAPLEPWSPRHWRRFAPKRPLVYASPISTRSLAKYWLEATEHALAAGISAARPGAHLGDVSAAIGEVARSAGYGLHTDYGGHGIGRAMHESAPHVPNDGRRGHGLRLRPGLTIAIEPWFLAGGLNAYRIDPDGWTLRSTDGSRGAHFEHTIAVTGDGPVILTTRLGPDADQRQPYPPISSPDENPLPGPATCELPTSA